MVTALVYGIPPSSGRGWAVVSVEESAGFVHTEPPCSLGRVNLVVKLALG